MSQRNSVACSRGAVLLELLVGTATIAVVIVILLPANQRMREAANHSTCQRIVKQLGIALTQYEADMGRFPRSMDTGNIAEDSFWVLQADKLGLKFSPNYETLVGAGYELSYAGGGRSFELVAVPYAPGLTASTTLSIDDRSLVFDRGQVLVKVREEPTPGADENRAFALAAIRECGKTAVAQLLLENGEAEDARCVKSFVRDETKIVFDNLDADNDGSVTFAEVFGKQKDGLPVPLLVCIGDQLQLGAGGERVEDLPGVFLRDLTGDPSDLFSYQEVCASTILATQKPAIAQAACKKLDAAEKAELRGKTKSRDNILGAYQSCVSAQRGKAIPRELANKLDLLAEILKAEEK